MEDKDRREDVEARAPGTRFRDCPECPEMVVAPAGRFMMGSPWWEVFRWPCEGPVHEVAMAHPFALGAACACTRARPAS